MRSWNSIEFWLSLVSKPPTVIDSAVAYGMCVWNTARADGRAWWQPRWMMNAEVSHSPSPSTTRPSKSIVKMSRSVISDQCGP